MKYLSAVNDVDRIYSLIWNTHLRNKYLLSNSRPPPPSSSSTASHSSGTTLVQEKEDAPASKKIKVYKFQRAWLKEFGDWLEWDSEKELMRCTFCKAFPMHASSSLVNGCGNFKRETLVKHSKSKSHIYCRDCYLNTSASDSSKATTQQKALPEVFARQETAQRADLQRELEIKFTVAYLIASETPIYKVSSTAFVAQNKWSIHQPNVWQRRQMCGIYFFYLWKHEIWSLPIKRLKLLWIFFLMFSVFWTVLLKFLAVLLKYCWCD